MPKNKKIQKLNRAIFLDRDGIINKEMPKGDYVKTWPEFKFLPLAKKALKNLALLDFKIIIVTNQQGIAKKLMKEKDLKKIHQKMQKEIEKAGGRITKIYYCPHYENQCSCRKPKTAMFLQAKKELKLDFFSSWLVGDSSSDILAGKKLSLKTIFIKNDSDNYQKMPKPDYVVKNLFEAYQIIKNEK